MAPTRTYQPAARPTIEENELIFYRLAQAVAHELDSRGPLTVEKWNELFSESRSWFAARP